MTKRLTTEQLEAIRKRAEAASAADWYAETVTVEVRSGAFTEHNVQPGIAGIVCTEEDADFIANARTDIPALLSEVERLRDLMEDIYECSDIETAVIELAKSGLGRDIV